MKIVLKQLEILNFKGIRSRTIDFNESGVTNIYGANAVGKSTIADAYRWVLTGKDSADRKDFEVKPTDANGNIINKLENEVTATLIVDGEEMTFRRTNKEKWVTKRGTTKENFDGNETKFYINDVPMAQKEYQTKLSNIISEANLKMLTDTGYFNGQMNWQERRNILTSVAGDMTDEQILTEWEPTHKPQAKFIRAILAAKKSFVDRLKELANKRKVALDEKENLPARIDEVKRGIPMTVPYERIKEDLAKAEAQVAQLEHQIFDTNEADNVRVNALNEKRAELQNVQNEMATIERSHTTSYNNDIEAAGSKLNNLTKELEAAEKGLQGLKNILNNKDSREKNLRDKISHAEHQIDVRKAQREDLLLAWKKRNAEQLIFADNDCTCPTCKQDLPQGQLEAKQQELLTSFNNKKQSDLNEYVRQAESLKKANELDESDINITKEQLTALLDEASNVIKSAAETEAEITNLKSAIEQEVNTDKVAPTSVQDRLDGDVKYRLYATEKWKLETDIAEFKPVDVSELIAQKNAILPTIEGYKADLLIEGQIKKANERIAELEGQEETLAQTISEYEQEQFAIHEFTKAKMDYVENAVNSMFTLVKFRMFREQINGGEEPACDCLVNGVEYTKNLNTAAKVNAGIDVINVLSKHFQISAPVFCDNRESVTSLIDTDAQVINLIVSPVDRQLRVEQCELELSLA